jgi:dienelactone hydrolase
VTWSEPEWIDRLSEVNGSGRSRRRSWALLWIVALVMAAGVFPEAARGQDGTLIPRIAAALDSTQSYALYLPPGHGTEAAPWPAVILMDPRGRARVPLERFRAAAAEHGFVLLSSYNTSSDEITSAQQTRRAVEVILNEVIDRLELDPTRVYLAGFSGTGREGWRMAVQNPDHIAGVAVFGAGIPPILARLTMQPGGGEVGVYVGGAGRHDYNYQEVRATEQWLGDEGSLHRFLYYAGGHDWPPPDVAERTLAWFRLHGLRTDRAPAAPDWVTARIADEASRAQEMSRNGHVYEAWRLAHELADGFEPLGDVGDLREAEARLRDDPSVARTRDRLAHWGAWEDQALRRSTRGSETLLARTKPTLNRLVRAVGIPEIERTAGAGDTLALQAAERQRASLVVMLGFYRFRELLAVGRPDRARLALEVVQRADPQWPGLCPRFRQLPVEHQRKGPLAQICLSAHVPLQLSLSTSPHAAAARAR